MSETAVSSTVAFLFGGMIFLLVYTRLGGLPTVGLAGAILVGYILLEMVKGWRALERAKSDRTIAEIRWGFWKQDRRGDDTQHHSSTAD